MTDKNKIQANSVDNNKIQASLTEQWKKGELPEGHYYVKDGENMIAEYLDGYFYNDGNPMTSFSGGVDSVLDKVPSYDEWKAKDVVNIDTARQIKQLKELLKEVYVAINEGSYFDQCDILKKIDEALQ